MYENQFPYGMFSYKHYAPYIALLFNSWSTTLLLPFMVKYIPL